jgi:hypothetical protein
LGKLPHTIVVGEEGLKLISQVGMLLQKPLPIRRLAGFHRLQILGDDFVETSPIRRVLAPAAIHRPPPGIVDAQAPWLTDGTPIRHLAKRPLHSPDAPHRFCRPGG